jgi:glycosyltransferase involved in cell wall biosynthesis
MHKEVMPLVSVIMLTYNQSQKAVLAFDSLLNQTYSPLEILVADDCSGDDTFYLLSARAEEYKNKDNRHKIILQRNDKNLGVAKSCENIALSARGELLVTSGGDDISYPTRVEVIVKRWMDAGKKPSVIFHGFRPVNLDGNPLGKKWWMPTVRNPLGMAMAYSRVVVDKYPLITESASFEDCVFARRAYALGDPLYIDDVLVDYRQGSGMTSEGAYRNRRSRVAAGMIASAKQNLIDLERVKCEMAPDRYREIEELLLSIIGEYEAEYSLVSGRTVLDRFKAFRKYISHERIRPNFKIRSFFSFYLQLIFPRLDPLVHLMKRIVGRSAS